MHPYEEDDYYEEDAYPEDEPGFDSFLQEQLAHTPWWAISLSVHLFVLLVILPLIECQRPQKPKAIQLKAVIDEPAEELLKPEDPHKLDNRTDIHPELEPVKDPIDSDLPPDDHNETDNDEPDKMAKGRSDANSDAQLEGKFNNDAIGAGGGAGGKFGGRLGGNKNVARKGGSQRTENAVMAGLIWLRNHQSPSGKWDGDGYQSQCRKNTCSGTAKMAWVDPGLTGLATLAFLGAGHTHRYGRFKKTVKAALRYMMKVQSADGLVGGKRGHYLYNHSIAALALVEAYGMTKSPLIRSAAIKSIKYLIKARNPGMAWRYEAGDGQNDVSVTGWAVMALKSAKAADIEVEGIDESFKDAERFIESITEETYGATGYKRKPPPNHQGGTSSRFQDPSLGINSMNTHAPNHTPTAIATMCRVFFGYAKRDPRLSAGATLMSMMPPVHEKASGGKLSTVDYYYWYYGTLAMFQVGGSHWKSWNKYMKAAIVDHQRTDGDEDGSWDPHGAWSFAGGRCYATAINVLSLEIYYRYPRAFGND